MLFSYYKSCLRMSMRPLLWERHIFSLVIVAFALWRGCDAAVSLAFPDISSDEYPGIFSMLVAFGLSTALFGRYRLARALHARGEAGPASRAKALVMGVVAILVTITSIFVGHYLPRLSLGITLLLLLLEIFNKDRRALLSSH